MTMINTMAYGSDGFEFRKRALFKCSEPLDFSYETSVTELQIGGTEPEGTSRRIIFQIDGKLYRFVNNILDEYTGRGELEDILENGNTVAELLELKNIQSFVGKKVFPLIALDAPADSPVFPKIKIAAKVNSYNDIYTLYKYSPVYELPSDARIFEAVESKYTNGNATVLTQCKINDGEWLYLADCAFKDAQKIQFRSQFVLSTLDGSDFAKVNSVKLFYQTDKNLSAAPTMEIISKPQDFNYDLKTCYALINHSELVDSQIKAFVSFSKLPIRRENVMIGTATGETQTLNLAYGGVVDSGIVADSIHLEVDNRTFPDFYFDVENSTVTLKADAGKEIFASYDIYDAEDWREMEYLDGDTFSSRFCFNLADSLDMKVCNVKFVVTRLSGSVENETLGLGTGKLQTFFLPHRAKLETLQCTGDFLYDENSQILKVVAPLNMPVVASYDWQGQLPQIKSYSWGVSI